MTDREMLEAAAKAAGIKVLRCPNGVLRDCTGLDPAMNIFSAPEWNPLTDDGDALRLAVKRRFHINIFSACSSEGIDSPGFVEIWCGDCDPIHTEYVEGGDYETATRRAIVKAVAEIGRGMA
jgi:hypothetical protein